MTLIPIYKVCPSCKRRYAWNPDAMQMRCPYCRGAASVINKTLRRVIYRGKPQIITFKYYGTNISSIMERLPTAKIVLKERRAIYTIQVEAYDREREQIEKWLRKYGDNVTLLDN